LSILILGGVGGGGVSGRGGGGGGGGGVTALGGRVRRAANTNVFYNIEPDKTKSLSNCDFF
jgi:hypothetical protein